MADSTKKHDGFVLEETSVAELRTAYANGTMRVRDVVESYLDRIEKFDANGPEINSIITINPEVLNEAQNTDDRIRRTGRLRPLEGIPVILKDQIDSVGMPTTLGSVLFKDYVPDRDATVVTKLKAAGALILAKATLGEMGGGDAHGTLFGSTHNPYDLTRTVGGSSGGPAAAMSCNFGAIAVGQETFASIRRPASWTATVGLRPTTGLVSRAGSYGGGPSLAPSLGPMTRNVADLAVLLDALVGYDPEDPVSAFGVGRAPDSYAAYLHHGALRGSRIGVIRDPIGQATEPTSDDFAMVDRSFEHSLQELAGAGAILVDPLTIPHLVESFQFRYASSNDIEAAFTEYFGRSRSAPFASAADLEVAAQAAGAIRPRRSAPSGTVEDGLKARERLFISFLKVMTDLNLDAIVHKSVEHQPTLITDGLNPPYVNGKGAPYINTFLLFTSTLTIPSGFTEAGLPTGITFLGRPYDEGRLIALGFDYEQLTSHRLPPVL